MSSDLNMSAPLRLDGYGCSTLSCPSAACTCPSCLNWIKSHAALPSFISFRESTSFVWFQCSHSPSEHDATAIRNSLVYGRYSKGLAWQPTLRTLLLSYHLGVSPLTLARPHPCPSYCLTPNGKAGEKGFGPYSIYSCSKNRLHSEPRTL